MDSNREEALRAKSIAEKRMENKDFSGALKVALRAQQLYPDLENVSQMILVCEVHCSAESKSFGTDKDWYGILKIEPSADDLSIKKQYRKLALILHPDKNKFAGSADAFKLIGEAQRVLLDREKRLIHDSKRRNFSRPNSVAKEPSRQPNVGQHPWNQRNFAQGHTFSQSQNHFTGGRPVNLQFGQQRAQTGVSEDRPTFWTVCSFCSYRYQFYKDAVLNKVVSCLSCKKSFFASESAQDATPATNQSHPSIPQQNNVPSKGAESINRSFTVNPVFQGNNVHSKEPPKAQGNVSRKRKKKVEESSESSVSESSSESEEDIVLEADGDKPPANEGFSYHSQQRRRSSRSKRNVSYRENLSDNDDDVTLSNKAKKSNTSSFAAEQKVHDVSLDEDDNRFAKMEGEHEENKQEFERKEHREPDSDDKGRGTEKEEEKEVPSKDDEEKEVPNEDDEEKEEPSKDDDISDSGEIEPEVFECPDPDFSDFDKNRREESFAVGQMWAVYDNEDAMPRYYALIENILSPGFKVKMMWLEAVPENKEESKWKGKGLPVSCGKFKRGESETAEDLPMFSHLVPLDKNIQRGEVYFIYPRKGETWALFKDWNMKWCSSRRKAPRTYEYEFVEILSDYNDSIGVQVSFLEKVKGFKCVFRPKVDNGKTDLIPPSEKFRFSHMVPSCSLAGEERVPKGSYELDPASLPQSLF